MTRASRSENFHEFPKNVTFRSSPPHAAEYVSDEIVGLCHVRKQKSFETGSDENFPVDCPVYGAGRIRKEIKKPRHDNINHFWTIDFWKTSRMKSFPRI